MKIIGFGGMPIKMECLFDLTEQRFWLYRSFYAITLGNGALSSNKSVRIFQIYIETHVSSCSIYFAIIHNIRLIFQSFAQWFFTRGQFWPTGIAIACVIVSAHVCVYQSLACPHDNSSAVQDSITKCGAEVQNTLIKNAVISGDNRQWLSRWNLTSKSNFA